ncbi:MAG: MTH1187 family thiamine-binding protein [Candidatus Njordarchaeia archaeon]
MARIIASFSIVPLGVEGTSLSKYVALALKALKENGVKYTLTPMCTILEGESLDEIFGAIKLAHKALEDAGIKRILIRVNVDDRIDRPERKPGNKIESVKKKLETGT